MRVRPAHESRLVTVEFSLGRRYAGICLWLVWADGPAMPPEDAERRDAEHIREVVRAAGVAHYTREEYEAGAYEDDGDGWTDDDGDGWTDDDGDGWTDDDGDGWTDDDDCWTDDGDGWTDDDDGDGWTDDDDVTARCHHCASLEYPDPTGHLVEDPGLIPWPGRRGMFIDPDECADRMAAGIGAGRAQPCRGCGKGEEHDGPCPLDLVPL